MPKYDCTDREAVRPEEILSGRFLKKAALPAGEQIRIIEHHFSPESVVFEK